MVADMSIKEGEMEAATKVALSQIEDKEYLAGLTRLFKVLTKYLIC